MRILVRIPIGFPDSCRSRPTTVPATIALSISVQSKGETSKIVFKISICPVTPSRELCTTDDTVPTCSRPQALSVITILREYSKTIKFSSQKFPFGDADKDVSLPDVDVSSLKQEQFDAHQEQENGDNFPKVLLWNPVHDTFGQRGTQKGSRDKEGQSIQ